MELRLAGLLLCALLASSKVGAQQPEDQEPEGGAYTPAYGQCMDASGGVTAAMLDCMAAEMQVQDARLNRGYLQLQKASAPARQEQLKKVQRAWVSFRDLNCDFYAEPDGGSMVTVSVNGCLLEMTAMRADELAGLLRLE